MKAFLQGDYDVLWLIDNDMRFLPEVGLALLGHGLDIVGCDYRKRVPPDGLTAGLLLRDGAKPEPHKAPRNVSLEGGLRPVLYVASGMLMIRRRVFETVPAPWFWCDPDVGLSETGLSNDYNFCLKAAEHGFQTWCDFDASRSVGHIGSQCWMYDATESFPC